MASLSSDSPLAKRIVRSFLHFLNSVELTPEVDSEAIIVASQCLADVFGLDVSHLSELTQPDLAQLFIQSGYDATKRDLIENAGTETAPHVMLGRDAATAGTSHDAKACPTTIDAIVGCADERLFEQYRDGLESAGYFDGLTADTPEYQVHLGRARNVFTETLKKVSTRSGASEQHILAESFKGQGNNSMANSHFIEAIDLYTMAISLCGDNAVYYSNRAAAHTQVGKYEAAIADSNKAIQLDPNYSKAYSRLGLAYYTQGKYQEAIEKGFQKAYSLDPNSKSIQENLQVAQKKLNEERARSRHPNPESSQQQQQTHSNNQGSEARFSTSIPLNMQLPQGMADLFPAVANLAAQLGGEQASPRDGMHGPNMDGQPSEVRLDGNMNVTVEGDPQFAGLMQSMLQMFAGASGQTRSEQPDQNPSQGNQDSSR